ncbi:hypothetical protein Nepgr_005065 [Nepenthes gracilis]|uniref:Uncharacterized protein n=1 Tax=Nepenthes gracilis TaxID=150966 RepID=A0AAD3XG62_NEPGR|nr:hypothetical protein Nepgr_005065 [Nepenthes gracilis]
MPGGSGAPLRGTFFEAIPYPCARAECPSVPGVRGEVARPRILSFPGISLPCSRSPFLPMYLNAFNSLRVAPWISRSGLTGGRMSLISTGGGVFEDRQGREPAASHGAGFI